MKTNIMPRLFWAGFLLLLLLASCKSSPPPVEIVVSPEEALRQFMNTAPDGGKPVFLGVAGIRSKMEESVNLALEEAARRVAVFHGVEGEFYAWSNNSARLFDYTADSGASLSYDTGYKKYIEALEFDEETDVFRSENAVYVRVRYPGVINLNYQLSSPQSGGKPYWIENPPAMIGEYNAGVGYSSRRDPYRLTVTASYDNAIFSIIRNLHSVSWTQNHDSRGSGFFDGSYTNRQGLEAKGTLSGFYVLETWIDPADMSVWTLAVAKK